MQHKKTREIKAQLIRWGYDAVTADSGIMNRVNVAIRGKAGMRYTISFMAIDGENDVRVSVRDLFVTRPDRECRRTLALMNSINAREDLLCKIYRDMNGSIALGYDFTEGCLAPEKQAPAIIDEIKALVDEIYPQMMTVIRQDDAEK